MFWKKKEPPVPPKDVVGTVEWIEKKFEESPYSTWSEFYLSRTEDAWIEDLTVQAAIKMAFKILRESAKVNAANGIH